MSNASIVRLENIRKTYQIGPVVVDALQGLSLTIEAGEYVSIMGPSGCGKSTLLNVLGCLDRPTSGQYFLGEEDVSRMDDDTLSAIRGARLGFVFQSYNLIQQLTVVENIEIPLYYRGCPERQSHTLALEMVERVGLGTRRRHRPAELSGGQQQRAAIARALVNDPLILLADEPTGNLDSASGVEILKLFDELHEQGKTLIIVTHDPNVSRHARRVICLRDGQIESDVQQPGPTVVSPAAPRRPGSRRVSRLGRLGLARLGRTVRLGIKSLWQHRLRSLLTALGIVFGVCSVIAMLAIGEGASYEAQEQIKNLGSQNIILRSVKPPEERKVSQQSGQYLLVYGLTYADLRAIQQTIPGVVVVVPGRIIREYVWNISRRVDSEIVGTVPWYPQMRNHRVAQGRFFSDAEVERKSNVCVLGAETAQELFPLDVPLGRTVRVGNSYYHVIGVMEHRSKAAEENELAESTSAAVGSRIYLPLETISAHYGDIIVKERTGSVEFEQVVLHEVTVKVDQRDQVVNVSLAVKCLLDRKHKKADYRMIVPLELLKRAEETKRIFSIVLGSIAAISLLVGGIGIMNIMLASVTERTREIGIRRALGAKRRHIVAQFLVETVLLSGVGGIIGVIVGVTIPHFVTVFAHMKTIVTFWSPLVAFTISAVVGVVFGLYPALRAAHMNPVEALRHE